MAEADVRSRLLRAGTDLVRGQGYVATRVSEICAAAGVSKGAFFHHFESKEDLVRACLARWCEMSEQMDASSPHHAIEDPVDRVSAFLAFMVEVFSDPTMVKSCLAGTTVQETYDTHPGLREGAQACFDGATTRITALIDAAAASSGARVDAQALASLWMATLQGALVLAKASGDDAVITTSLTHVKTYIEGQLRPGF